MNANVLPTPTSLSSHMRPPMRPTMRRHSVRPRPVPSCVEAPRPPCSNDSKIRSRSSCAMPTPVSVTVIATSSTVDPRLDGDLAAVGCELHRIAQKIDHDLFEAQLIGLDEGHVRADIEDQAEAMAGRAFAHHRDPVLERVPNGERDALQVHVAGLHLGQVEDVAEELEEMLARAPDVPEVLLLTVVDLTEHAVEQHLREADDRVERGAQLVRHAGEELRLVTADDLQLGRLPFQRHETAVR